MEVFLILVSTKYCSLEGEVETLFGANLSKQKDQRDMSATTKKIEALRSKQHCIMLIMKQVGPRAEISLSQEITLSFDSLAKDLVKQAKSLTVSHRLTRFQAWQRRSLITVMDVQ